MSTRRMLLAAWVPLLVLVFPAVALADDVSASTVAIEPGTKPLSVKVSWSTSDHQTEHRYQIELRDVTSNDDADWMSAGSAFQATGTVGSTGTGAADDITMADSKALVYATTYEARVSYVETTRVWISSSAHGTKPRSQPSKPAVPAMPTGVNTEEGDEQVTLTWNAVATAISYKVEWKKAGQAFGIASQTMTVKAPTVTATVGCPDVGAVAGCKGTLENGTTYTFQVTATNEGGDSEPSEPVTATPTGTTGTGAVSTMTAGPKTNTLNTLTLTWIYNKVLDDIGVDEGFYVYYVKGSKLGGKTPTAAQIAAVKEKLDSKQELVAAERTDAALPQTREAGTVAGTTKFTFDLTGLTPDTLYAVTVHPYAGAFKQHDSDANPAAPITAATNPAPAPTGVRNVEVVPGDKTLTVTWDRPTNTGHATLKIDTYRVRYNTSQTADDAKGNVISYPPAGTKLTATEYKITGLLNGVMYDVQVAAENDGGALGPWSPSDPGARATPSATGGAPAAPEAVEAVAGDAMVTVSWQAVEGATKYMVEWRTASQTYGAADRQAMVTGTTHEVENLVNGMEYMLQVKAGNDVGYGPASGEVTATPMMPTPALPVFGALVLGAGLVAAGRRRLRARQRRLLKA